MAAEIAKEIKKYLGTANLVVGTDETIKKLKAGKVKKVFLSSNCPANVREDIKHYSRIAGIEIIETEHNNIELGVLCKKPFPISVVCLV